MIAISLVCIFLMGFILGYVIGSHHKFGKVEGEIRALRAENMLLRDTDLRQLGGLPLAGKMVR